MTVGERPATIVVSALGELVTASGILAARDLGDDADGLAAFARKVPPGRYPADAAVAGGRVLGIRIRFAREAVVAWHPATVVGGNHVVGVDAANVAVFAVVFFVAIDAWRR